MTSLPPLPQQPPLLAFGQTSHRGSYNSLPASPRSLQKRELHPFDGGAFAQQQMPRLAQQYAHPLQRTNSYPSAGSPKEDLLAVGGYGENMLRRKTPNGTLNAGYDGSMVEGVTKPHPSKHIILPVSSKLGTTTTPVPFPVADLYQSYSGSSGLAQDDFWNASQPSSIGNTGRWDATVALRNPQPRAGPGLGPPMHQLQPLQLETMLNQIPVNRGQRLPYYGQQVPSVLQPPFQNAYGPTAIPDTPVGPYWPNGAFVPYKPAAIRDPRYYHVPIPQQSTPSDFGVAEWISMKPNGGMANGYNESNQTYPLVNDATLLPHKSIDIYNPSVPSVAPFKFHLPQPVRSVQLDLQPQNQPFSALAGVSQSNHRQSYFDIGSGSSNLCTPSVPPFLETPTLTEFGPLSMNARYRDKVLSWAHTVYVDLLALLHHTRRQNSSKSGHGSHPPRPTIYPKPPRQPGSSFSSPSSSRKPSSEAVPRVNVPLNNNAATFGFDAAPQEQSLDASKTLSQTRIPASWSSNAGSALDNDYYRRLSLQHPNSASNSLNLANQPQPSDRFKTLRRSSGSIVTSAMLSTNRPDTVPMNNAVAALDLLTKLCQESDWQWVDGLLLGGCLAYGLGDYGKALQWYSRILEIDSNHVEAISNLAATLLALNRRQDAEKCWYKAVKLRPNYFEAVEHLVGLLCGDHKGKEAVALIEYVERMLRYNKPAESLKVMDDFNDRASTTSRSPAMSDMSDRMVFDYEVDGEPGFKEAREFANQPGFGSSGYAIPGSENGRILALIHAKGNMLYALNDNAGAAKAFENAVLIGVGRRVQGIRGLIQLILNAVSRDINSGLMPGQQIDLSADPILLPPEKALQTARLCFPSHGELPGLRDVPSGMARKAAISTMSNSLLSLAKIFQDGMTTNSASHGASRSASSVREILALYYLSLSLQPSPSTANNVGILLASVQQSNPGKHAIITANFQAPQIPGVVPGSGIALALAYYNYGLNLDRGHAHLYTNLGSLLKDIGQLTSAIQMYERAVQCDPTFDIALANLANAVKDQGRISDAIMYYRRAVDASPDFAEAVCGLANALNSVCGWAGRGGVATDGGKRDRWHVDEKGMLLDAKMSGAVSTGWIKRVVDIVEKQLLDGEEWGKGVLEGGNLEDFVSQLSLTDEAAQVSQEKDESLRKAVKSWAGKKWEGSRIVRLVERASRRIMWQWYQDTFITKKQTHLANYMRPLLPANLTVPTAPTVLPFHTFTCPMSAKQVRQISQRNGLRISVSTLKSPWMLKTVFPPPAPPAPQLRVGYVSSDFNNHPLAHLMQSVFGMHDPKQFTAYCYATTASDNSIHRHQIEQEAPVFYDASSWSAEKLVTQIVQDGIHILVNLNGYTRGARNEVFAARPVPIQMSFMGFAGTLGAEWCDYLLADETAVPPSTLRPWRRNVDLEDAITDETSESDQENWVYGENIVYCRDTFFCCDHRQSAPDSQQPRWTWEEEQTRRWQMRKELFPHLADDAIIMANFNQLYKIEPTTFRTWLRILAHCPKAILWLLRFPDLGESNLKSTAQLWAGHEVASRVIFTNVAPKHEHISRARIVDLFLDTPECNAHTTAADVLWSGTPLLTLPRYEYKMCSRMAASILGGALPNGEEGDRARGELVVKSDEEYEARAVALGNGLSYTMVQVEDQGRMVTVGKGEGRLSELRKLLFESRWSSALFDTKRWVRDLEDAYGEAWRRWVRGEGGDIWLNRVPVGKGLGEVDEVSGSV